MKEKNKTFLLKKMFDIGLDQYRVDKNETIITNLTKVHEN